MPEDRPIPEPKAQIPTNLRLLLLIEEVARLGVPVLPSALCETLNLPKPTVHRLLTTAEEEGFLQRHLDGRSYGPGVRLRQVAANTLSSERVRSERLLIMRALAEEVEETCNLAAPGRYGMVYLDRVETHWPLRIQLPIGSQVPFHCTASGKTYLASLRTDRLSRLISALPLDARTSRTLTDPDVLREALAETRARGHSTDDEEFMDGMCAIAVPIHDSEDRVLSALAIHAPLQRHTIASLQDRALPHLQTAAAKLSALLD